MFRRVLAHRWFCLALVLAPVVAFAQIPAASREAPPGLRALDEVLAYLIGDWVEVGDAPGEPARHFTFERALDGHAVVRRSRTAHAATMDRPARVHEDLMLIYPEGGQLRATLVDSEGQVLHYATGFVHGTGVVTFTSQPAGAQPRYRVTYTPLGARRVGLAIEIALPEMPGTFRPYRKAVALRAK